MLPPASPFVSVVCDPATRDATRYWRGYHATDSSTADRQSGVQLDGSVPRLPGVQQERAVIAVKKLSIYLPRTGGCPEETVSTGEC